MTSSGRYSPGGRELSATSLNLWRADAPRAVSTPAPDVRRLAEGRSVCARCTARIEGRPLPRQLATLSLLGLALCRECFLDVEASADSYGESGHDFDDRISAKLIALSDELTVGQ